MEDIKSIYDVVPDLRYISICYLSQRYVFLYFVDDRIGYGFGKHIEEVYAEPVSDYDYVVVAYRKSGKVIWIKKFNKKKSKVT